MGTMESMQRTWTEIGAEYVERLGLSSVEEKIAGMDWQDIPEDEPLVLGAMQGFAIKEMIAQFGLPYVTRVAVDGFERPEFAPGFYAIEANFRNGRARVYVLDIGSELVPVVSDFWPVEAQVTGGAG